MNTLFDWLSVALFSGLAVLFLSRSARPEGAPDRMIAYLPPALGCAAGNQLGNHGHAVLGSLMLVAVVVYVLIVLKPRLRG